MVDLYQVASLLSDKTVIGIESLQDIILGGKYILHGLGRFLIADIKCKKFLFKTCGCCT